MGWLTRALARLLPSPPEIGPDEDVVFVDVRTPTEYARGHARGAINIPLSELDERWSEVAGHGGKRVIVYCLMGSRASRAVDALRARGVAGAEDGGGLSGLRRAGIEVVREDG